MKHERSAQADGPGTGPSFTRGLQATFVVRRAVFLAHSRGRARPPRRRLGGWRGTTEIMVILLLLVAAVGTLGPVSANAAPTGRITAPATADYPVNGTVYGYAQSNTTSIGVPISGDTVSAVPETCAPYFNVSGTCSPTFNSTTSSLGNYTLELPNGTYYLYTSPDGEFGGDSTAVQVNGASVTAPTMHSFFEMPYSNTTYVLPDFTSLSAYVSDHSGTQVPVLSYASDGVFYINSSNDLVYYSFPTKKWRAIAPWDMLYDQIGYLGELNNYFYLTFDGTYAYELGCAVLGCGGTGSLIVYAVNTTTGRSFTWNTGILRNSTKANAGVNLVGRNGNDSLMALLTSNGTIHLYNPWNGTAWNAGQLSYFEANNVYWVPFLNSYINIEAEASSTDDIEQVELEGPGSGTSFVPVFGPEVNGPGGVTSNGVNGLAFDLTLNEMVYNYGSAASGSAQTVYSFADGVVSKMDSYGVEKNVPYGRFVADDHRLSVTNGAPVVNGYYDPDFYNQSWVADPFSGRYFDTNVQEGYRNPSKPALFDGAAGFDGEPAHQFLNATSAITAYSVNCANSSGGVIPCPLLGTTLGTILGTIYYVSEVAAGPFPYPASAPISQPERPAPLVLSETDTSSSVTVTWEVPSLYPILNFTFYWGLDPGALNHPVNLAPTAHNFTISGLSPGEKVYYAATVTDLNSVSLLANGSVVTPALGPPAPTGLTAATDGPYAVNLTWTNPAGNLTDDTVNYATTPNGPFTAVSEGVVTSAMLGGLSGNTEYYFEVATWNSSGEGPTSNEASVTVLPLSPPTAPTDLNVTAATATAVSLSWVNPSGELTNDTVYYATAAPGPFTTISERVVGVATVGGLHLVTRYYFEVAAWNPAGESSMSNEVTATTLGPPSAPTGLGAVFVTSVAATLSWTNPTGTLTNDTLYVATDASGPFTPVSEGVVSSATLTGLHPETQYSIEVAAWNSVGEGPVSNEIDATTLPPPPPPAPTDLFAVPVNATAIRLSWIPPSGNLLNYTVAVGTVSGVSSMHYNVANGTASRFVVTGLAPITLYYFALWAWTAQGAGAVSPIVNATTNLPVSTGGTGIGSAAEPSWMLFLPFPALLALGLALAVRRDHSRRGKGEG